MSGNRNIIYRREQGFTLIAVLVIFALAMLVTGIMLRSSRNSAHAQKIVTLNDDRFYNTEDFLGEITAWFQNNSLYLAGLFTQANYATYFVDSAPLAGDNEASSLAIPTLVKIAGSSPADSALISNHANFGTSNFPLGLHISTAGTKDLVADFQSNFPDADNGGINIRLVLLSARHANGDYAPVFRVDAITGNTPEKGSHLFSYVSGSFVENPSGTGFYGNSSVIVSGNPVCKSRLFSWSGANWNMEPEGSDCLLESQGIINLSGAGIRIYGAAKTNTDAGVDNEHKISNNNSRGCEAVACHTDTLSPYTVDWGSLSSCSSPAVNTNTTWSTGQCYGTVTINGVVLTLSDTVNPYYMDQIIFNGAGAALAINPGSGAGNDVRVYVNKISDDYLSGKRILNNFAPNQFKFIYTGTDPISLTGDTDMKFHLYARNTSVTVSGNLEYYGAINAAGLSISGNSMLYSDGIAVGQTVKTTALTDLDFRITKVYQE